MIVAEAVAGARITNWEKVTAGYFRPFVAGAKLWLDHGFDVAAL